MDTKKFKKRVAEIPDDMPIVIEMGSKLYTTLTAKVFTNHSRLSTAKEFFAIVANKETSKEDLKNEVA